MLSKDPFILVLAADKNYAMPLSVTISSLLRNTSDKENIEFHILDGGLTKKQRELIFKPLNVDKHRITFHPLKHYDLPHPDHHNHLTVATSYRFLIPNILSSGCSKALYIDSDVLVTGDISKLWAEDISSYPCAGVTDSFAPRADSEYGIHNFRAVGIAPETKCLNAGVLLMNLHLWREQKISEQSLDYLTRFKDEMKLVSQQALNATLQGNWLELNSKWNQLINPLPYYDADPPPAPELHARERGILHFITTCKPWHHHYPHPYREHYLNELTHTSWKGWQPPKPSLLTRMIERIKRYYR